MSGEANRQRTIDPGSGQATLPVDSGTFTPQPRRTGSMSAASPPMSDDGLAPGTLLVDGRFRITRRLGQGGMGVVYEAHDERRRAAVALKVISQLNAAAVYLFKSEFRSLADVSHPNLCRLYELFSEDVWFFTMELVRGQPFDSWVRPGGTLDETRLRSSLRQLHGAVLAIHAAGKLHRDLKPANVLVTEEGRVVVLDFGLAMDQSPDAQGTLLERGIAGTPAYMAPEQARGAPASKASDYYSVGVMLFQALAGCLPFNGRVGEVLASKQRDPAPSLLSFVPGAPSDLAALTDGLLETEPEKRPDAFNVEQRLGAEPASSAEPVANTRAQSERDLFVGRELEIAQLQAAYQATFDRKAVVVFVAGESGMGKTSLIQHFLKELESRGEAVVLKGRCYERESVPFKALDSVVDDLSRYLRKLPSEDAHGLMPRDVFALARLFPALERVEAVARAPKREIPDHQELRSRAYAALHELLGRISDRRPLVAFIDDLQWMDHDSAVLFEYLFSEGEPPPSLLIVSQRSEGSAANSLLERVLRAAEKNRAIDLRTVAVGQLSAAATRELATRMLGEARSRGAETIAAESQGSPFLVGELVRHSQRNDSAANQVSLKQALEQHLSSLREDVASLLDVLAVAGRPLPAQVALDAAGVGYDAVDLLAIERLLRISNEEGDGRRFECYHDKIRECAFSLIGPEALQKIHRRLADTLSAWSEATPEHLALHYHGAGEYAAASLHYEAAGTAAARALTFDHAARQYEQALILETSDVARALSLRLKWAQMLASAGRSRDAAGEYLRAAQQSGSAERFEYLRLAAHWLMLSGAVDEGRAILSEVLAAVGLRLPRSVQSAIAHAVWSRARLSVRGHEFRSSRTITDREATRLDALWTVAQSSMGNDPFVMVDMAARYTRLSLDSGAHAHAARALSMEAYLASFKGETTHKTTEPLLQEAERLAGQVESPELVGWLKTVRGCVLTHVGRFADARPVLTEAGHWLGSHCTAVPFELAFSHSYNFIAAQFGGEFHWIGNTAPAIATDALRKGDLCLANTAAAYAVPASLALGRLEGRDLFAEYKRRYQPQSSYQWSDYMTLFAELNRALYDGTASVGVDLVDAQWQALGKAQLMRLQIALAMMVYLRASCVLSAAPLRQPVDRAVAARVRAAMKILGKIPLAFVAGFASTIGAGLAQRIGQLDAARDHLQTAVRVFDACRLTMYGAAARRRLGALIGGDEGAGLLRAGDAAMASEHVVDLQATTAMLTPVL